MGSDTSKIPPATQVQERSLRQMSTDRYPHVVYLIVPPEKAAGFVKLLKENEVEDVRVHEMKGAIFDDTYPQLLNVWSDQEKSNIESFLLQGTSDLTERTSAWRGRIVLFPFGFSSTSCLKMSSLAPIFGTLHSRGVLTLIPGQDEISKITNTEKVSCFPGQEINNQGKGLAECTVLASLHCFHFESSGSYIEHIPAYLSSFLEAPNSSRNPTIYPALNSLLEGKDLKTLLLPRSLLELARTLRTILVTHIKCMVLVSEKELVLKYLGKFQGAKLEKKLRKNISGDGNLETILAIVTRGINSWQELDDSEWKQLKRHLVPNLIKKQTYLCSSYSEMKTESTSYSIQPQFAYVSLFVKAAEEKGIIGSGVGRLGASEVAYIGHLFYRKQLTSLYHDDKEALPMAWALSLIVQQSIEKVPDICKKVSGPLLISPMQKLILQLLTGWRHPTFLIIGSSQSGKTSLFHALTKCDRGLVGTGYSCHTKNSYFQTVTDSQGKEHILWDSVGFREAPNQGRSKAKQQAEEVLLKLIGKMKPDVIVYVVNIAELENATFEEHFQETKKLLPGGVPIMIVVTKIDKASEDSGKISRLLRKESVDRTSPKFRKLEIATEEWIQNLKVSLEGRLTKLNLTTNSIEFCSLPSEEIGDKENRRFRLDWVQRIDPVTRGIQRQLPVSCVLERDSVSFQLIIGHQIVKVWSVINASISLFPGVEMLILPFTTRKMLEMLALISISPDKTYKKFFKLHSGTLIGLESIRTVLLGVSLGLEIAGIFTLGAGTATGVAAGLMITSVTTLKIGSLALEYFTGQEVTMRDIVFNDDLTVTQRKVVKLPAVI